MQRIVNWLFKYFARQLLFIICQFFAYKRHHYSKGQFPFSSESILTHKRTENGNEAK